MPTLSVAELVEGSGGALVRGDTAAVVSSYCMDSRAARPGAAFFALPGSRTDGHAFLGQARDAGALVAVVERVAQEGEPAPPVLIRVDDVPAALGRLATWVRRRHSGVRWIALTGSNGKTTTKEMIAAGLAARRKVHRTPGNLNNHLGVPLTLLALPDDVDVAVVEMAMSGPGEIAVLTKIVDPDIGLLTNVRTVHMEFFRTVDDVAAAKGEMFSLMRDEAIAVVNLDEMHVRVQAARHVGPRVTFGRHPEADLQLEQLENRFVPGATLAVRHGERTFRLQLRIGGAHAAYNALAALATVLAAGEELGPAAERIEALEAGPGRGRVHDLGEDMLLVDDSYNNSPPALASVLETLRLSEPKGRRVLVLGDMLELGAMEIALHREAGRRAAAAGVQLMVGIGPLAREAAEAARRSGVREVHHFDTSADAAPGMAGLLRGGDLIVVKGSRGVHLERIVQALTGAG